ncbi:hypothetical protein J6590_105459 [Homalodisca vitripennis]|nr:hypothetical protein J6590_105459 [Homalodisca vitripennis]
MQNRTTISSSPELLAPFGLIMTSHKKGLADLKLIRRHPDDPGRTRRFDRQGEMQVVCTKCRRYSGQEWLALLSGFDGSRDVGPPGRRRCDKTE